MRTLAEVFGRRTHLAASRLAAAKPHPGPADQPGLTRPALSSGCRGNCADCGGKCRDQNAPLGVLFLSRQNTGHKGLAWNGWHSRNALRTRGVRADAMQAAPEEIAGLVKTRHPRIVVLMAFWVPIATVENLARKFPGTTFVIKNHSGPQFLAQEKEGWNLLFAVADLAARMPNVRLAAIKSECVASLRALGIDAVELPNVYTPAEIERPLAVERLPGFHVGLFGAYRALKNAVGTVFALAAAARQAGEKVTLHVNGTRSECGAVSDARVIPELCRRAGIGFEHHGWLEHEPFKRLAGSMTIALQPSFSETYNYVAADCVTAGTPVVGSDAIYWLPKAWRVNPDSPAQLATAILAARRWPIAAGLAALRHDNTVALTRLITSLTALGQSSTR